MDKSRREGRLAALIRTYLDSGQSLRDIERRANSAGAPISYSQIHAYTQGTAAKAPTRDQIAAISAGLPASETEVRRAVFLDWYGYDPIESDEYLIPVPGDLPAEEKRQLELMVRAWLASRE